METEPGVIIMALWLLSRRQVGFWHWICKIYLKTQMSKRVTPRQKRKKKRKKKGHRVAPIIYMTCFSFSMFSKDLFAYGRAWFCLFFFFFVVFGMFSTYSLAVHLGRGCIFRWRSWDSKKGSDLLKSPSKLVAPLKPEPFSYPPIHTLQFPFQCLSCTLRT